jgi:hypothetical protein
VRASAAFRFVTVSLFFSSAPAVLAVAPAGRFVVSSDLKTVIDTKTGLVWQRDIPSTKASWTEARNWCRNNSSSLPGSGWRLPSSKELISIVDTSIYDPAIDLIAFPNTPSEFFWTSTPWSDHPTFGWAIDFSVGLTGRSDAAARIRCVR